MDASFGSAVGTRVDLGANEWFESVTLMPGDRVVARGATDAGDDAIVVVELDAQGQPNGQDMFVGGDVTSTSSAVVHRQ